MKAYKLTNENSQTLGGLQWGPNITHEVSGNSKELCSPSWLHFYDSPELAVVFNSIHVRLQKPILWEAEAEGEILSDNGIKFGCKKLTTRQIIPLPEISLNQKIVFGILCAKEVYKESKWNLWANKWLSGEDRTYTSDAASDTAATYASNAAAAAATYATYASNAAAYAAAAADTAAAATASPLNLKALIKKALEY